MKAKQQNYPSAPQAQCVSHHGEDCSCSHAHQHEHGGDCGCGHTHHTENTAQTMPADGAKLHVFSLENLGCANCAAKMEARIRQLPGVEHAAISFATKQLRVSGAHICDLLPQMQEICTSIEAGVRIREYKAVPQADAAEHAKASRRDLLQIVAGAVLFLLGVVLMHTGLTDLKLLPLFILAYLILGGRILLTAGHNIVRGRIFDENFLMCLATLGAFAIREFPEAVGVMLFYRLGEYFEHVAVERSRSQIMQAVDLRPEVVNLLVDGEVRVIPAEDAAIGDLLLIRPGDRIPLDGVLVEGESRIDTSPITGESVPVAARSGDSLLSGCINVSGQLTLRVEKPLCESMVTRILNSVENAAAGKPKIDRFITRFARIYTPIVVAAAALTAVIPSLITGNWNYWIYTALTFLVMSCPCALVLSVPLAFFSGLGKASRKGILFKGGAAIEALSGVSAVVLDKTGTVTKGDFVLQNIHPCGDYSQKELLRICASCEQHSNHPIAQSIVSAAQEWNIALEQPASMQEIAGHGVEAVLDAGKVICGNLRLMAMHKIDVPREAFRFYGAEVCVAVNGRLEAVLQVADTLKSDAKSAVSRLQAMGLRTAMLTGDSEASAKAVAQETGIGLVHARLLPQDKLKSLREIRSAYGAAMFVGDGINDAPVLAGADVGAAMGSGADAAIEAADAVFMTDSMEAIPEAVSIARGTKRIAMQNVVFALAVKLIVMLLGLLGYANMWLAVFADTGVAMLCVLNSIRALYRK